MSKDAFQWCFFLLLFVYLIAYRSFIHSIPLKKGKCADTRNYELKVCLKLSTNKSIAVSTLFTINWSMTIIQNIYNKVSPCLLATWKQWLNAVVSLCLATVFVPSSKLSCTLNEKHELRQNWSSTLNYLLRAGPGSGFVEESSCRCLPQVWTCGQQY